MGKRAFPTAIVAVVVALCFGALPVGAQEPPPPVVPEVVNIEDPIGDANFLNDQGQSGTTGHQGEHVTPVDAGSVSDFAKVWFTNDASTVSAVIVTEAGAPAINGLRFDVFASPGEGSASSSTLGCIRFVAVIAGKQSGQNTTWQGPDAAKVFDACNEGTNWFNHGVEAELSYGELEDGSGFYVVTAPMTASPFLAIGQVLAAPSAIARVIYGADGVVMGFGPYTDNTVVGTDYTIAAPEEIPPPGEGKKKGCKKGKGKKKGACPREATETPGLLTGGRALAL